MFKYRHFISAIWNNIKHSKYKKSRSLRLVTRHDEQVEVAVLCDERLAAEVEVTASCTGADPCPAHAGSLLTNTTKHGAQYESKKDNKSFEQLVVYP